MVHIVSGLKRLYPFAAICAALFLMGSAAVASSILPRGLALSKTFQHGYGAPVGRMLLTQGTVVILHRGIATGFFTKRGLPLYKGDTLYTEKKSRARFRLNDGSIITLSSFTKMTINQSIYSTRKKQRRSFLSLAIGKARFVVSKLFQFRNAAFKVKSGTFVAGVRGSDFIINQTDTQTTITTLDKTTLEVLAMNAPQKQPIRLSSFQRISGSPGGKLRRPVNIPLSEIDQLKQGFQLPGDLGAAPDAETGSAEKHTGKDQSDKRNKPMNKKEEQSDEKQRPTEQKPAGTSQAGNRDESKKSEPDLKVTDRSSHEAAETDQSLWPASPQGTPLPGDGLVPEMPEKGFLVPLEALEKPNFISPELKAPTEPPEIPPELDQTVKPVIEKPEPEDTELPGLPGPPQ